MVDRMVICLSKLTWRYTSYDVSCKQINKEGTHGDKHTAYVLCLFALQCALGTVCLRDSVPWGKCALGQCVLRQCAL